MKKLLFATSNQHKLSEIQHQLGEEFQLLSLKDIDHNTEIPETQPTIAGNAIQKAEFVAEHYQMECFADDTGLEVEALDGAPGVYSARYAGEEKSAEKNMDKLLTELVNHENKTAQFTTVIALYLKGKIHLFDGVLEGQIIDKKRGDKGFGYDPIFVPNGYDITLAEMTQEEKNAISHRGKAVKKLVAFLKSKE